MTTRLKIFIYCQHVWGLGHFFRIREILRALDRHDVVLVTGGPRVPMPLPAHVRRYQLPVLQMGADRKLEAGDGGPAEAVWPGRIARLHDLFVSESPDVFLVELYPLGRTAFGRELDPLLAGIRCGRLPGCRVYCSVRDILVAKSDPAAFETRVCRDLNRWFDALLVHADPSLIRLDDTFGAMTAIQIPVVYTGFIAGPAPEGCTRAALRRERGIGVDETLVVVSAGGGRAGFPLLAAMLTARERLIPRTRTRMVLFTGPYLPDRKMAALRASAAPGVEIRRFSTDFRAWLAAADLSVSMAGYNTCMDVMTAGVPALVWPFEGDREQPLRAARLAEAGALAVLAKADLEPRRLAARIADALCQDRPPAAAHPDLEGALQTARYIQGHHEPPKRIRRKGRPLKILVYCQHLLGVGHLFRTLEICRALAAHDVVLVTGGRDTPLALPDNVRQRKLPELVTDRAFQHLHSPTGETLESIRNERRRRLGAIFREEAPEVFLIELYPFGRKGFRFELDPLLADMAEGHRPACQVICSVRDILVEKEDPHKHEIRVVHTLNRWFDALLVHADPDVIRLEATFGRMADIRIPVAYTGFVAPPPAPQDRDAWKRDRGLDPHQALVVVSAGGGSVGYPLLAAVTQAVRRLPADLPVRVQVFAGPYLPAAEFRKLGQGGDRRLHLDRFAADFPAWLQAADLSISMAGYNTCMAILATGVRALVHPFGGNREQGLRARLLAERGLLEVLSGRDLRASALADRMLAALQAPDRGRRRAVDIDGAANTARWIETALAKGKIAP